MASIAPTLAEYQAAARQFLSTHATPRDAANPLLGLDDEALAAKARSFQKALHIAGLAGASYPPEYGGNGLGAAFDHAYRREAEHFHIPTAPLSVSHGMCLPLLNAVGTDEQRQRHLRPIISGDELWVQLFSEPSAGSDLAGLRMRATQVDGDWVLDGQKVWTSWGHLADFGLCLARTDWSVPKHEGLTMFIVDLRAPGVDIRPIRDLAGRSHFNEIFLTNVRVSADAVVGAVGAGWTTAMTMLGFERESVGGGGAADLGVAHRDSLRVVATAAGIERRPDVRAHLITVHIAERVFELLRQRMAAVAQANGGGGPEGSLTKLALANVQSLVRNAAFALHGAAWDPNDTNTQTAVNDALHSIESAIGGGTNEIQRNIIGERMLGLPREPQVDRGIPFNEVGWSNQAIRNPSQSR